MAKEILILIENGKVVNYAETYREQQVREWANEKPNRHFDRVEECT